MLQTFASPAYAQAYPPPDAECVGFVTGGPNLTFRDGAEFDDVRTGLGRIDCDGSGPTNIQVQWGNGNGGTNTGHFTDLLAVNCCDDPAVTPDPPDACFDTITGVATGTVNLAGRGGTVDARLEFTFVDAGEPAAGADQASLKITTDNGQTILLNVRGTIDPSNIQAHSDPNSECVCPECP
ncbi:MAG: hypothetical protein M3O70_03815 [Actinomycetota bacterium]|nr:hypothetical protein [Actinomycetota bacterium]